MADAMLQRGFAASTRRNYVRAIYDMAKYYRRDPAEYSASDVQSDLQYAGALGSVAQHDSRTRQ
jgi:hypothetical protein